MARELNQDDFFNPNFYEQMTLQDYINFREEGKQDQAQDDYNYLNFQEPNGPVQSSASWAGYYEEEEEERMREYRMREERMREERMREERMREERMREERMREERMREERMRRERILQPSNSKDINQPPNASGKRYYKKKCKSNKRTCVKKLKNQKGNRRKSYKM